MLFNFILTIIIGVCVGMIIGTILTDKWHKNTTNRDKEV